MTTKKFYWDPNTIEYFVDLHDQVTEAIEKDDNRKL